MSPELTNKLYAKYPDIFRDKDKSPRETLICFGFEFSDGWFEITDKMLERIQFVCKTFGCEVVASQSKEKYSRARFYYYTVGIKDPMVDDIIQCIVADYENRSSWTCEITGGYGRTYSRGGWLKTLCEDKAKELGYETEDALTILKQESANLSKEQIIQRLHRIC